MEIQASFINFQQFVEGLKYIRVKAHLTFADFMHLMTETKANSVTEFGVSTVNV